MSVKQFPINVSCVKKKNKMEKENKKNKKKSKNKCMFYSFQCGKLKTFSDNKKKKTYI